MKWVEVDKFFGPTISVDFEGFMEILVNPTASVDFEGIVETLVDLIVSFTSARVVNYVFKSKFMNFRGSLFHEVSPCKANTEKY